MATDSMIAGLFSTPEQYQQAQSEAALNRGIQLAQLDPLQRASAQLYQGGYLTGGAIGGALGGQDPQLKLQSMRQQLLRNIDWNDPTSLANASRAALENNDVQASRELAMAAEKAKAAQLEAAVKTSQITRNIREPRAAALPNIQKLQEYRKQAEENGASPAELAQIDAVIKAEGQGKGTNISLGLSTVDKESNLRKDFTTETKPITTVITTADRIDKLLTGNTSLGEVIARKQFAKLAGDTNISNRDVADLANFGDLGQRLSGILSGFFEGKYSEAQRQEALGLVKQLKAEGTNQYSTIQNQYRERAAAENIPEKTGKFIAPDLPTAQKAALPPEGTRLRNKKTGKIEVVRGGKLVPSE
jgi:hypothetical protein